MSFRLWVTGTRAAVPTLFLSVMAGPVLWPRRTGTTGCLHDAHKMPTRCPHDASRGPQEGFQETSRALSVKLCASSWASEGPFAGRPPRPVSAAW